MTRWFGCLLGGLALLASWGCIVWPFPTGHLKGRGAIRQEDTTPFVVGRTTQEDVLLRLGAPDLVLDEGRTFLYRWEDDQGLWAVSLASGLEHGVGGQFLRYQGVRVSFDPQGLVLKIEFDTRKLPSRVEIR